MGTVFDNTLELRRVVLEAWQASDSYVLGNVELLLIGYNVLSLAISLGDFGFNYK